MQNVMIINDVKQHSCHVYCIIDFMKLSSVFLPEIEGTWHNVI